MDVLAVRPYHRCNCWVVDMIDLRTGHPIGQPRNPHLSQRRRIEQMHQQLRAAVAVMSSLQAVLNAVLVKTGPVTVTDDDLEAVAGWDSPNVAEVPGGGLYSAGVPVAPGEPEPKEAEPEAPAAPCGTVAGRIDPAPEFDDTPEMPPAT
jgi:hypothetical protein